MTEPEDQSPEGQPTAPLPPPEDESMPPAEGEKLSLPPAEPGELAGQKAPEEAVAEAPQAGAPPAPQPTPRRHRGWMILLSLFILLLLLAGGLGAAYYQLEAWSARPFGAPGEHKLKILPRTPTRQIAHTLQSGGLVSSDLAFAAWLRLAAPKGTVQAGEFIIHTPIAPRELIQLLRHGAFERSLTIPEGWTARQIADRLLKEHWINNQQEWLDLVATPAGPELAGTPLPQGAEGFCFPETYRLDAAAKPDEILKRMLARFHYEWDRLEPARRDPRSTSLTATQVVVLASMIEREARTPAEMPGIASVYLNRIVKGMKLECCATVRYALGGVWDRPLYNSDLKVDSPYNTYRHKGLPPGAIANPGRDALAAVLRPAQTDFLFYVYAGNNQHVFSRTYAEHMKAVKAARNGNPQEAIPEQDAN